MISRNRVLGGSLVAAFLLLLGALFVPGVMPGFGGTPEGGVTPGFGGAPEGGAMAGLGGTREGGSEGSGAVPMEGSESGSSDWLEVEVATVGMDLLTQAPLALLRENWDEVLPIWIGQVEAEAILLALQGVPVPRPMTHDLMVSLLGGLGAELLEVRVHSLREETYIGSLHIRLPGRDEPVEIDTRPSDGLALAVRTGARVRVARDLVQGIPEVDFVSWEEDRQLVRIRGVTVNPVGAEYREGFDLPHRAGMVVLHSTAAAAPRAVRAGDLIVAVRGRPIDGVAGYVNAIGMASPTAPVPVTVVRGGEEVPAALPPRGGTGRVG